MVFDDIVGQYNIVRSLKNAIANDRIGHAYLFCGPDGVGKSIAASVFAAALNCRNRGTDPCGNCPSCIRAKDGNHPDIIHVKVKGSSISIDDIRKLQSDIQKKPYEKGVKVFIIHEAEKMTEQAQNALLKTLEEPPGSSVIVMLAQNQYVLLNTIISRCQILKFSRAPEKNIEEYLKRKMGVDETEARQIAAFSEGIVGKAVEILNDDVIKKDRDEIIDIVESLCAKDKIYALSRVDYFMNKKDRIDYILGIMMSWFRDILIFKECGDTKYLTNLDKAYVISDECSKFSFSNLYNIINSIKKTSQNIDSNANFQLSIETMLLNIQEG